MSADFEELEVKVSENEGAPPEQVPGTEAASDTAAKPEEDAPQAQPLPLGGKAVNIDRIQNIKVKVEVVLGGVSMTVAKLMELKKNEVVVLEKEVGSSVDVLANGNLIARGEIVVIEGDVPKFGISLSEIVTRDPDANVQQM